jgi:CheY-like chemotaxis protein
MRVMIVDDDPVTAEALAAVLRARGHAADWAANAESALVRLRVHRADVLVIDHFLPGTDGLGMLAAVRADPALRAVPALLITAACDDAAREIEAQLPALGRAALLRKPFEVPELFAALEALALSPPQEA